MKSCIVIGGGLAGLSAAVHLAADKGFKVKLFEGSPKTGGRAYSFFDRQNGEIIDNGQHIMMGCYRYSLEFLQLTGASHRLRSQKNLNIPFSRIDGSVSYLKADKGFYPFNLLLAMLGFDALSWNDRKGIIRMICRLFFLKSKSLRDLSASEWLMKEKQSPDAIKSFWEILILGALNSKPEQASAEMLAAILKQIFFRGNKASTIILPSTGLSELFCEKSVEYIHKNGGQVVTSAGVKSIIYDGMDAVGVILDDGRIEKSDFLISAVPHFALKKLIPEHLTGKFDDPGFTYSPILSMHIFLKNNMFREPFYGLINSPVHWVFNHGKFISVVISGAESLNGMNRTDIECLVLNELKDRFPFFSQRHVSGSRIIMEKRATFIPAPGIDKKRPESVTAIGNFFLAGDWINTGLPATIEGAIKSGKMAARQVIRLSSDSRSKGSRF